MTRKIKFRAWFKPLKRMYVVREMKFERNGSIIIITNHTGGTAPNSYEVMQLTGFPDKKGEEVYEGDLVKIEEYSFAGGCILEQVAEIKFIDGCFEITSMKTGMPLVFPLNDKSKRIKVVGNKFENPELLE